MEQVCRTITKDVAGRLCFFGRYYESSTFGRKILQQVLRIHSKIFSIILSLSFRMFLSRYLFNILYRFSFLIKFSKLRVTHISNLLTLFAQNIGHYLTLVFYIEQCLCNQLAHRFVSISHTILKVTLLGLEIGYRHYWKISSR